MRTHAHSMTAASSRNMSRWMSASLRCKSFRSTGVCVCRVESRGVLV